MEAGVRSTLESFRSRGVAIISEIDNFKRKRELADEFIEQSFGKLAESIVRSTAISDLIDPRTGGRIARNYLKNSRNQELKNLKEQFNQNTQIRLNGLIEETRSYLGKLSIREPDLRTEGNSKKLLKMLNSIYKYSTPKRRLSELCTILERIIALNPIENSAIPHYLSSVNSDATIYFEKMNEFEKRLRCFIRKNLKNFREWEKENVPSQVINKAQNKMRRENEHLTQNSIYVDFLDFVEFSDYLKIIVFEKNWASIFKNFFKSEQWIKERLIEITKIRNSLMHSRTISSLAKKKLDLYLPEILEVLGKNVS